MSSRTPSDAKRKFITQHISAKSSSTRLFMGLGCAMVMGMASLSASASTLISSTKYLDYSLPKSIQERCTARDSCPDIDIKYLNTSQDWINSIANKRINSFVVNAKPSESPASTATSSKAVKAALDDFAKTQLDDMTDNRAMSYNLMVTPEYLGHVNALEMFQINSYVFTGGAHGMSYSEYLIVDPSTKKQVTLADMLQNGKKSRFEALAYKAYKAWVKTVSDDAKSYEKSWPFTLSDNVTLTDKGIDIGYQQYEIGPYAYGMPVLSIPYADLHGIIKPHFMPTAQK